MEDIVKECVIKVGSKMYPRKFIATSNGWADFVFDKNYSLMKIERLKAFISKFKHLALTKVL